MKRALLLVAVIGCLWWALGTGSARADSYLVLTGNSGSADNGVYVGPYPITVDGTLQGLVCDDYSTHTTGGESWYATVNTWATLTDAKFYNNPTFGNNITGPTSADDAYKQVFWLTDQMQSHPSQVGPINYAIWAIMDPVDLTPAVLSGLSDSGAIAYWLGQATLGGSTVNTGNYLIYTPDPLNASQEFIRPVPIPSTLLLLIPGLLGIVGLRKRPGK